MKKLTHTRPVTIDQLQVRNDGRTVEGRIVPYNEPAAVVDIHPETLRREPFLEVFTPGAIAQQLQKIADLNRGRTNFIRFNLDHGEDLSRQIGFARELSEKDDGAYATFGLYDSENLDLIQSMLRESHDGLSVEFVDHDPIVKGDTVYRRSVEIRAVAATPFAAYQTARILAVREDTEDDLPWDKDDDLPPLRTPDLDHYRQIFGV